MSPDNRTRKWDFQLHEKSCSITDAEASTAAPILKSDSVPLCISLFTLSAISLQNEDVFMFILALKAKTLDILQQCKHDAILLKIDMSFMLEYTGCMSIF